MTNILSICPLCGEALLGEVSNEHVFGEAFGGRSKIRVHFSCNSEIGAGAEGALHRGNSAMNFVASLHGLAVAEVLGVAEDGTQLSADFGAQKSTLARPTVEIVETADFVTLNASGREEHLRKILKDWRAAYGDQVPAWDDLTPEQRRSDQLVTQSVEIALSLSLEDAESFAIKVALGAGVLAFGEGFSATPLAASLRDWKSTPLGSPLEQKASKPRQELEFLTKVDGDLQKQIAAMRSNGEDIDNPSLLPSKDVRVNQVVFVPVPSKSATVVFVHILGIPLPPYGFQVAGEIPYVEGGFQHSPLLVRESEGELEVTNILKRLIDATSATAKRAEEEMLLNHDE